MKVCVRNHGGMEEMEGGREVEDEGEERKLREFVRRERKWKVRVVSNESWLGLNEVGVGLMRVISEVMSCQ